MVPRQPLIAVLCRGERDVPKLTVRQQSLRDVFQDMARVSHEHRNGCRTGKIIVISANGKTARAVARGAERSDRNGIYLDEATRDRLGVSQGQEVEFTIREGGWFDEFLWAWHATNAMPRVGARLGVVSVLLGLAGLLLGALSFVPRH